MARYPGFFARARWRPMPPDEARISPEDLRAADGLCLGNALSVRTVSRLDGQEIKSNPAALAEFRAILEAQD